MLYPLIIERFSFLYWQYRHLFLRYRWYFIGGFVALCLTNVIGAAVPQFIQQAIHLFEKKVVPLEAMSSLEGYLLIILGVALAMMLIRLASRILLLGVGRRIEYDLRNILFEQLLRLPLAFFTANPTGELMSRLTNDVQAIRFLCGGAVMLIANALFAYLARVPVMIRISPVLTLWAFLIYPFAAWGMSCLSRRTRALFFKVQEILGDISTLTQENLSGINVIQGYVKESAENKRFQGLSDSYFQANKHLIRNRVFMFLVMSGVSGLGLLITLLIGGIEAIHHHMSYSRFIQFTLYLEQLAWPTMSLGWAVTILQQGGAALQRIDKVLAAPLPVRSPAMQSVPLSLQQTPTKPLALEIRHLNFRYENPYTISSPESLPAWALQDISLELQPGMIVVLVGPIGAGKSTLLQLLPGLYKVPDGAIFLGGEDINRIPLERLRGLIVLMPQQSFLFSSTVEKNIAYGLLDISEKETAKKETSRDVAAEIIQAARTAGIHEEILGFQDQYETVVGERGILVSGGQRQRLTLARAFLMDAPVLLLDDPFSNVDSETEREILDALIHRKVSGNKLTLIATHRLSIARQADQVMLMDHGRVAAMGSHAELMATQPLYQRLNRKEQLESQCHSYQKPECQEGPPV